MKKSRYQIALRWLIFWTLFIGVGAVAGAVGMLADPSGKALGMDAMLPYFQILPFAELLFQNFTFSGWALLTVNGVTNLTAVGLLLKNKRLGVILGGIFGITLMLWICIQFYIFPLNFMSTVYFIFGVCQAVAGYTAYIFRKQEEFPANAPDYLGIGKNPSRLVVYFSRMGYVQHAAREYASQIGANLYEIKTPEKTDGALSFWWCGRYGMHRWEMPTEEIAVDLSAYDEVTVCSPIWVFSLAAPVRGFLKQASGKIKSVSYIFVHFTNGRYESVAKEADKLLGIQHSRLINIRCRAGEFKRINPK